MYYCRIVFDENTEDENSYCIDELHFFIKEYHAEEYYEKILTSIFVHYFPGQLYVDLSWSEMKDQIEDFIDVKAKAGNYYFTFNHAIEEVIFDDVIT